MPSLVAISNIDFPYKTDQQTVKECASNLFAPSFPGIERMLNIFDNTEIKTRNFCKPLSYYAESNSFQEQNKEYTRIVLDYAVKAIEECIAAAGVCKEDITDMIFLSTTGLATPSLDALIINKMRLNQQICRYPVFGLGCAGGVAGYAKASILAKGNPDAIVLVVAAELCSLTFLSSDFSKSNLVGSSLFADGISALIISGDNHVNETKREIDFIDSQSKLYFDTEDVMGWEFLDKGFKVLFSQDIPEIISLNIHKDVAKFLDKHELTISDISNFIFHPGGKKILNAYQEALLIDSDDLKFTIDVMTEYGNMSSPTVLYVLGKFFTEGFEDGYGLMVSMGPGFSSEMVLLKMYNK